MVWYGMVARGTTKARANMTPSRSYDQSTRDDDVMYVGRAGIEYPKKKNGTKRHSVSSAFRDGSPPPGTTVPLNHCVFNHVTCCGM